MQDRIAEATGTAEEAFSQIRTVQSFTAEERGSTAVRSHLHRRDRRGNPARADSRDVFRNPHVLGLRRSRGRALAGRASGTRRKSHRRRARLVPPLRALRRRRRRLARLALRSVSGSGRRRAPHVRSARGGVRGNGSDQAARGFRVLCAAKS